MFHTLFNPKTGSKITLFNPKWQCFYTLFNPKTGPKTTLFNPPGVRGYKKYVLASYINGKEPYICEKLPIKYHGNKTVKITLSDYFERSCLSVGQSYGSYGS